MYNDEVCLIVSICENEIENVTDELLMAFQDKKKYVNSTLQIRLEEQDELMYRLTVRRNTFFDIIGSILELSETNDDIEDFLFMKFVDCRLRRDQTGHKEPRIMYEEMFNAIGDLVLELKKVGYCKNFEEEIL